LWNQGNRLQIVRENCRGRTSSNPCCHKTADWTGIATGKEARQLINTLSVKFFSYSLQISCKSVEDCGRIRREASLHIIAWLMKTVWALACKPSSCDGNDARKRKKKTKLGGEMKTDWRRARRAREREGKKKWKIHAVKKRILTFIDLPQGKVLSTYMSFWWKENTRFFLLKKKKQRGNCFIIIF
jgi:hypothetical protein